MGVKKAASRKNAKTGHQASKDMALGRPKDQLHRDHPVAAYNELQHAEEASLQRLLNDTPKAELSKPLQKTMAKHETTWSEPQATSPRTSTS